MKIAEKRFEDDGKLIIQKTHDPTPSLERARLLRDAGKQEFGESRMIASVPGWLVSEWLKDAGVAWDDPAMDDVIKKKLLSGDVSKFRVWDGTY